MEQKTCTYPRKSPWIQRVPAHSLAADQLQEVLLGGSAPSWLSYFVPRRRLVDIHKLHFPACEFHFCDNRVLCKAIYSHVARQREHFGRTILLSQVAWSEKDTVYLQACWCWWREVCFHRLWFPQLMRMCKRLAVNQEDACLPDWTPTKMEQNFTHLPSGD